MMEKKETAGLSTQSGTRLGLGELSIFSVIASLKDVILVSCSKWDLKNGETQ